MPGYDGTGPRGMGPMTGRGLGYCAVPGAARGFGVGRGGWFRRPFGAFGWGRGAGIGRVGYGWGGWDAPPSVPPRTKEQELEALRQQARLIEEDLEGIRQRIDELET